MGPEQNDQPLSPEQVPVLWDQAKAFPRDQQDGGRDGDCEDSQARFTVQPYVLGLGLQTWNNTQTGVTANTKILHITSPGCTSSQDLL